MLYALDKRTGKIVWERVAYEGAPVDTRHIKSTYASATPATDGRIVVAWFGSQGVYAYDVERQLPLEGRSRPHRTRRLRHPELRVGTGELADPLERPGDPAGRHAGRLVRPRARTPRPARRSWKTERDELPSWGTPTVVDDAGRPGARDQRLEVHPRLRPANGQGAVAARRQLEDHGADADLRRRPVRRRERPRARAADLRVKPGARGDLTLKRRRDQQRRRRVEPDRPRARTCRRRSSTSGMLYVLANNGVFDAYDLKTGEEIYRQRLPHVGSGFSASPVAADGKIYLSSEDGEMLVVAAGREFKQLATNSMGELLMATPALSDGVMFVRASQSLFAVGRETVKPVETPSTAVCDRIEQTRLPDRSRRTSSPRRGRAPDLAGGAAPAARRACDRTCGPRRRCLRLRARRSRSSIARRADRFSRA